LGSNHMEDKEDGRWKELASAGFGISGLNFEFCSQKLVNCTVSLLIYYIYSISRINIMYTNVHSINSCENCLHEENHISLNSFRRMFYFIQFPR
jgi:hypothetical protein